MKVQVVFLLLFLAVGVDIRAAGLSTEQGIAMSLKTSDSCEFVADIHLNLQLFQGLKPYQRLWQLI